MSQFGFRVSPNTQGTVVSTGPANQSTTTPPPPSSMAVTSSAPAPGSPPAAQRCCDTGRPLFTDPLTGQSVCSCQYELLGYQRLAGGVAGLPPLSMYSTPYPEGMAAYFPALGADQAPFYSSAAAAGLELKENLAAGAATWPYHTMYHPYDAAFANYPFNGYGMDLNGARRKNATRETTSTLKAWLNEHKKNPYPTKGEKIMLAIITKMTLTQVSTWFANARRRLKKENKMTWEPRNRVDDEDNNNDDDDHKSTDGKDLLDSKDSGTASSEDGDRTPHPRLAGDGGSEWSESRHDSGPDSPECLYDRSHPAFLPPRSSGSPPPQLSVSSSASKPRIWSLADMASKESDAQSGPASSAFYSTATGRLVAPLSGRLAAPPGLSGTPYARTHELYRSLYGSAAAQHLASAGASVGSPEVSLLESYSRSIGASLGSLHNAVGAGPTTSCAPSSLSSVISKASLMATSSSASPNHPSLPLGLTTSTSRISPSSTSSVSSGSADTPLKPIALNKV